MRELFRGHYPPSDEQLDELWARCLFVLDTNVLLGLYRCSEPTRRNLLQLIGELSRLGRLWVPHQVALEYQSSRLGAIDDQTRPYSVHIEALDKLLDRSWQPAGADRHPFVDSKLLGRLLGAARRLRDDLLAKRDALAGLAQHDDVREALTRFLGGRVGASPSPEEAEEMGREAESRVMSRVPPGYADASEAKGKGRYGSDGPGAGSVLEPDGRVAPGGGRRGLGDALLWLQTLRHAKGAGLPVVFVTDDRKEDWWWRHDGAIVGPRPELVCEMWEASGQAFYMYRAAQFMEEANLRLSMGLDTEAIAEVESLSDSAQAELALREEAELLGAAALPPVAGRNALAHGKEAGRSSTRPAPTLPAFRQVAEAMREFDERLKSITAPIRAVNDLPAIRAIADLRLSLAEIAPRLRQGADAPWPGQWGPPDL